MSKYTPDQVETGLRALVLADFNAAIAHQRLKASGMPDPPSERTLREWKNVHEQRLEALVEDREAWVTEFLATKYDALTAASLQATEKMLTELFNRTDWEDMNVASLARAIKDATTTSAIATDKGRLLRDRPTVIKEDRSMAEILRALSHPKFAGVLPNLKDSPLLAQVIEGEAKELPAE